MEPGYFSLTGMGYEFVAGVQQCTHGADPAAEETAEKKCQPDEDEDRRNQTDESSRSQRSTGSKEGVNPEEDVNRIVQFIGASIVSFKK